MPEKKTIDVSWTSLWRILFFLILGSIVLQAQQILLGLFLAIAISSGLEFAVTFLERRGIPRTLGVILIFVVAVLCIILFAYLVIPLFIIDLKAILSNFNGGAAASYWLDPLVNFNAGNSNSIALFLNRISTQLFAENPSPLSFISDILGGLGLAVSVLISAFYLSLSHDGVERFLRFIIPPDYEIAVIKVYENSRRKIGYWFRSQIMLSVTMAVLTYLALYILGVSHGFVIAILAGLFELVPFMGPILAGALAFIVALTQSPILAFTTLIVFIVIHQIEANILVPVFMRRVVGLHPVIVIMALLIGLSVEGLLGALVAVPIAATLQEILEEWSYRKRPEQSVMPIE
jgi:predicted PurR-regulated permease PerM